MSVAIHVIAAHQNVGRLVSGFALGWKEKLLSSVWTLNNAHYDFHFVPPERDGSALVDTF